MDKRTEKSTGVFDSEEELDLVVFGLLHHGVTQYKIAPLCGISRATVSRRVNGGEDPSLMERTSEINPLTHMFNKAWRIQAPQ